jgi:hypothetical protein
VDVPDIRKVGNRGITWNNFAILRFLLGLTMVQDLHASDIFKIIQDVQELGYFALCLQKLSFLMRFSMVLGQVYSLFVDVKRSTQFLME